LFREGSRAVLRAGGGVVGWVWGGGGGGGLGVKTQKKCEDTPPNNMCAPPGFCWVAWVFGGGVGLVVGGGVGVGVWRGGRCRWGGGVGMGGGVGEVTVEIYPLDWPFHPTKHTMSNRRVGGGAGGCVWGLLGFGKGLNCCGGARNREGGHRDLVSAPAPVRVRSCLGAAETV